MRKLNIIILLVIAMGFMACQNGKVRKSLLPGVSGQAGEVIIVMEKDQWNGSPGDVVKSVLQQDVPGLPQSEPMFNTVNIRHQAFSELFRIHRNIVLCNISKEYAEPTITVENDKWAQPQTVLNINAPSRTVFMDYFNENRDKIMGVLLKAERDRLIHNYKTYSEIPVMNKLRKSAGVKLNIPKGYAYDLDTNNFIWMSYETPQISQGLFVYSYEYTDTAQFSKLNLINKRNEFLQNFVAGPREGSYMTTEIQLMPEYRTYAYKNQYTAEMRGLWRVEGDYMGGPFVSLTRLDTANHRLVTVEGYVYAPKYDKRNYVRQIEAILYTFEFDDKH